MTPADFVLFRKMKTPKRKAFAGAVGDTKKTRSKSVPRIEKNSIISVLCLRGITLKETRFIDEKIL